jgi:hypothetical protein
MIREVKLILPKFHVEIDLSSFSPKPAENFDGTLLSLALFCHSEYIFANNFSKPNILKRFQSLGIYILQENRVAFQRWLPACPPAVQGANRHDTPTFKAERSPQNQFHGIWECLTRSPEGEQVRRRIKFSGCVPIFRMCSN